MNRTSEINNKSKTSRTYNLISAILAFVLWGGWAFYINGDHGINTRIISGVAQGTASFLITLFMIRMITWIFHKLNNVLFQLFIPPIITVSFTGSCLVLMHMIVGTPNIFYTVAPALSVAFSYCLFTTFKLRFESNNMRENEAG